MGESKENQFNKCSLCSKCQFYVKESDTCKVKVGEKCSEKNINNCTDFLINEKLVFF